MIDRGQVLERARRVHTAVASDVLDSLGFRGQALSAGFKLTSGIHGLVGFAFTMRAAADCRPLEGDPYQSQIAATDDLAPGDVVVAATGAADCAFWGDLFSTAALARGCGGAVIDGLVRDTDRMDTAAFTTYSRGRRPVDSMQRLTVVDFGRPTEVGGVLIHPGDLLLADRDGVVVVPAHVCESVLTMSEEKMAKEDGMRAALAEGMRLSDAWQKYRVL